MVKIENQFIKMDDETLKAALNEYEQWCDEGVVPSGGPLAEARDKHCDAYDVHGLIIMENELLHAGSMRWLKTMKENKE